ncbi:hypothetical protein [Mycobacterium conspicuum]|jgi:hypothetical protein|uniref:Uncharacterized protein n=1 Tax=Mycobacterium conspicuum TaxID=44010 RepID=A0A1X1SWI2_9MYCO|nr:hypothetical protein [Mycobacterium conspicuum]ORV35286.1 hypothetical protein AWC00_24935 [Mycobacterium conspicuum]BBZ37414.1 hypothetical protein MCNS_04770 [Mycobacterium conspicuum]
MEIVDAFLPDSSANSQWYQEIEAFMFRAGAEGDDAPRTVADPINALAEIQQDWVSRQRRPTAPEASRLIYGLGAVVHLTRTVQIASMPFSDPTADERGRSLLADVFALTGGQEFEQRAAFFSLDQIDTIGNLFADHFLSWKHWTETSQRLVAMGVLTEEAASVPLCNACVITYNGIESVVVDSVLSSNQVSLNDLKAVVDPRNWRHDCGSFFCDMRYENLRTDGWRRVLETVGLCAFPEEVSPRLVTMLKFLKTTVNKPERHEARLDYELNDPFPTPPSDGKITVDHGFINMWTEPNGDPDQPPVYVRTRKVCHIDGMRPYTMKRFVCAFGYAFIVAEMLFGSALDPKAAAFGWDDPATEHPGNPSGQPPGGGTKPPPSSGNSAASTAIKMVAACVEDLTVKQYDLADKWMAGQLTVADLAQYGAEVGARIASDPWKFIQAITQPKGGGK